MKKLSFTLFSIIMVALISCQKESPIPVEETGTLVVNLGLSVREYKVKKQLKAFVPLSDFKVSIYKADGTEALVFETLSLMPDTIKLLPGNYYVEAHSNNNLAAAFDNPYYYGASEIFTISSNKNESVTVTCTLANTAVSVLWSDVVMNNYTDYSAKVVSLLDMLEFTKNETRIGYFQPSPLEIFVELWYINSENNPELRKLFGTIQEPLAGRHYEIFVNTTLNEGSGSVTVILDESEIPLELVEIKDEADNFIGYGDILITEIMFDPTALSDTEGEWIEIYNNSGRIINLENLILERDNTNKHVISSSIELLPNEYYVLARTSYATDVNNVYVYGTSITLPNNGGIISLYNVNEGTEQENLIFSVNYGASNFPRPSGASISLNPDNMNATDAVLGTSWCIATSVYNTGDKGTPGVKNDSCN